MIKRGVDPEVIALAVSTAETVAAAADCPRNSADISAERRREKDRLRKQRNRDIPQNSADVCGIPQNSINASLSKERKKEEGKEEREARPRNVRGHRLPDDWRPTAPDLATALALIGAHRTEAELAKFADHWKQQPGSRGVKLDWNATWRNWARRASEYTQRGGTHGRRTIHDAADDLLAKVRALDEPAPGRLRDRAGEGAVQLLPPR